MDVIFHGLSTSFQAAFAGPIVAEILVRTLLQVRIHRVLDCRAARRLLHLVQARQDASLLVGGMALLALADQRLRPKRSSRKAAMRRYP